MTKSTKIISATITVVVLAVVISGLYFYHNSNGKIKVEDKVSESENYIFVNDYIDFLINIDRAPYKESKLSSYKTNAKQLRADFQETITDFEKAKSYLAKWQNNSDTGKNDIVEKGIQGVSDSIKMHQLWIDAIFNTPEGTTAQDKLFAQADILSPKIKEALVRSGSLFAESSITLTKDERTKLSEKLRLQFQNNIDKQKEYETKGTENYEFDVAVWPAIFLNTWLSEDKYFSSTNNSDISSYLSGVGLIRCWQDEGDGLPRDADLEASGSLWKMGGDYVVLTNKHAVLNNANLCLLILGDSNTFKLVPTYKSMIKDKVDAAAMQILTYDDAFGPEDKRPNLNYKISTMLRCPQKMALGQPVKIIGYPAFTKIDEPGIWDDQTPKTVTEGTISAYYSTLPFGSERDPMPNYFISAKVDSGVSGGIAFSMNDDKLCLLGIPTWLNVGQYDTQGIVQNIYNVIN